MGIPEGIWQVVKEILRHVLRRPVVGVVAAARTADGRWLLVRRRDTNRWAMVGGTLEWGETLRVCIERELEEEAGASLEHIGELVGVYSRPDRDPRFHAVTVVVAAQIGEPAPHDVNPAEIAEVRCFADTELPADLSHGMNDMLADARSGHQTFE